MSPIVPPTLLQRLLDLERAPAARPYTAAAYNLDGFRAFLESLGTPQRGQLFLHVAGTKGKGSTCAVAEALLRGLGFPTALFSSPHLEHYGERFRFDGKPWSMAEFEERLGRFEAALGPEQRRGFEGDVPWRTVFETLTALALVEFGRRRSAPGTRPQVVCWETGLGGRLDCTNVVVPEVAVITTMGLDHQKVLGNTVEEIAREKAGIIKPGRPVVLSRQVPEFAETVLRVVRERAAEVGAPLVRAWEHNPVLASRPDAAGQWFRLRSPDGEECEGVLPLPGEHQIANLEAAVAAVWCVAKGQRLRPSATALLAGLPLAAWPGRFEVVPRPEGTLVLDGAHCPLSARVLARTLRERLPLLPGADDGVALVFSMNGDKDRAGFLREFSGELGGALRGVFCHALPGTRGASLEDLLSAAHDLGLVATGAASLAEAMAQARQGGGITVVTGTMYALAEARRRG